MGNRCDGDASAFDAMPRNRDVRSMDVLGEVDSRATNGSLKMR